VDVTAAQHHRRCARKAYGYLASVEPVLADLVALHGYPDPFVFHDGGRTGDSKFAGMLMHVVGQQISAVAAFSVYDRVTAATGGVPTATALIALGPARLRACGLSAAKAEYAICLADAQLSGCIDLEHLEGLTDEQVVERLTAVRGIGVWSAETFLVHNLHRPDVLPAGDLGIRRAVQRHWHLHQLPSVAQVRILATSWSPCRTWAAALLWRSLTPPGEASDPKERALLRAQALAARRTGA
jgi:DNA-3-methyladenine glycosylase II